MHIVEQLLCGVTLPLALVQCRKALINKANALDGHSSHENSTDAQQCYQSSFLLLGMEFMRGWTGLNSGDDSILGGLPISARVSSMLLYQKLSRSGF